MYAPSGMRHALIIPPYGFINDDLTDRGEKVTRVRVNAAAMLIAHGTIPSDVIVPFTQKRALNPATGETESLGENIGTHVDRLPAFGRADIRILSETWGTWADTLRSLKLIAANAGSGTPVHVHFVTERAQLGRLRIIWLCTHPEGWSASFHPAPNARTRRDIWTHEPMSYAKLIFRTVPGYFLVMLARSFRRSLRHAFEV